MRKSCFVKALCAVLVCTLCLTRTGSSQEVYFDDFDRGRRVAEGIVAAIGGGQRASVEDYAGIGHAGNEFGGQYFHSASSQWVRQEFRASPITLTLTDLPPHEFVSLDFLFARINTWDGDKDFLSVRADRQLIFSESFDFLSADQQTFEPDAGVLLIRDAPLATTCCDAAYDMSLQPEFHRIPHVADSLFVEWFPDGDGWQEGNDESFAIENVRVVLSGAEPLVSVPEPTAVEYLLAAFLSFGFGRRRRRCVRPASKSSANVLCGEFLESRECLTAVGIQATSIIPPYQLRANPLVAVVDMNADGIRDIVDFRNGIYVAKGLGEGRYQLPKNRGDLPAFVSRVVGVGDLDGDGDEDVMLSSIVSVSWIENDPASDELRVHDFFQDRRVHDVVLADLNDDGRLDVSVIHEDSAREELLSTFIATDGNNFEQLPAVSLRERFGGSIGRDVYISDFNSDGFLDVVASHAARPWRISWVLGISPGRLADDAQAIVASDSPALGLSPALQARELPFTVLENSVFVNNRGNVDRFAFEAGEINHERIPDTSFSGEVAFADVDDDGDRDLIALTNTSFSSSTKSLEWFPSDGEKLGEAIPINRFAATFDVSEADNGRLEVIVGSMDRVSVYTQMDNGLFAESSQPFRFGLSSVPIFADVDGDGMQDMVTAWNSGFVYAVHRGDGHGNYESAVPIAYRAYMLDRQPPSLSDLDGDGDLDLVGVDGYWYENAWPHFLPRESFGLRWVVSGDFNADGMNDLVSDVGVQLNLGGGAFAEPIAHDIPVRGNPAPAIAEDVDGDGDVDLVFRQNWYENDGLEFIQHELPQRINHVVDFDGDGRYELLFENEMGTLVYDVFRDRSELLSNVVFWLIELGGDFLLNDSVFEGPSFDDERYFFVAVEPSPFF